MSCRRCSHPVVGATVSNNNGVRSLQSGNFQKAIQCFHRALHLSHQFVVMEGTGEDLSPQDLPCCSECRLPSKTGSSKKLLSHHAPSVDDNARLQIFYEPLLIESCDFGNTSSPNANEIARNLVVATVILNTAISYHLFSFSFSKDNDKTQSQEDAREEYQERARALYEKVLQVLMTMDIHLNEFVGVQSAFYDLILMATLNNILSMMEVDVDPLAARYNQHLFMCALECGDKSYGESQVATSIAEWQNEFLANAMVTRYSHATSAPAA